VCISWNIKEIILIVCWMTNCNFLSTEIWPLLYHCPSHLCAEASSVLRQDVVCVCGWAVTNVSEVRRTIFRDKISWPRIWSHYILRTELRDNYWLQEFLKYLIYIRTVCLRIILVGNQLEVEVTGRQGRRRRKLLDDLKERRGYSHVKEEALDRTMWRARLGGGFGPVVRQTTKWMI
jgi:hypothetical protein